MASAELDFSRSGDLLFSDARSEMEAATPLDRVRIDGYLPPLNHFGLPPALHFGSDSELQTDSFCFAMRTYKVARDDAQSDSVHPVGYTTCQPSKRFQVHTIELRATDPKP
jgi:hypothetical protein